MEGETGAKLVEEVHDLPARVFSASDIHAGDQGNGSGFTDRVLQCALFGAFVRRIPAAFGQWGSEIAPRRHARPGRTGALSGSSDRFGANHSTTSSCSAKRTCAVS